MRIALNAGILRAPRTGIGRYVAELAGALSRQPGLELSFFYGWDWRQSLSESPMPGYSRWAAAAKRFIPEAYRWRRLIEQNRFDAGLEAVGPDLYHEPSLWPLDFAGPMVMTVHDLTHVHYPETQPRQRLAEIERRVGKGVEKAARILVDSAFIGHEVVSHFGLPENKVVVAPLGCSPVFHPREASATLNTLQSLGLGYRQYLLCVGTLEPRKNLALALRAYSRLPATLRARYPLLLVGMSGWREQEFAAELQSALATGQVRLAGYLQQEELTHVIASARALIYPSKYEGFGLPVLESMACGTPVIVSDRASLPEVAGAAGIIVDAADVPRLVEAMRSIIEDESRWQACRQAGLEQAARFSWERCAEITAQTYRDALAE